MAAIPPPVLRSGQQMRAVFVHMGGPLRVLWPDPAETGKFGAVLDRKGKKIKDVFSFQLPFHPDHGARVLRMSRILIQHGGGGGEDRGIRV